MDPGEKEAILEAGGPGPPGGGKGGQLASDSGVEWGAHRATLGSFMMSLEQ